MKRFAAHYLYLPETGFIKQQVVEVTTEGVVANVFPLTEEVESVEWFPGVIALVAEYDPEILFKNPCIVSSETMQGFFDAMFAYQKRGISLFPFLFYPFDFIAMQPVAETQHRLLR